MSSTPELELTRACAAGDAAALAELDPLIAEETRRAVASLAGSSPEEIAQRVRERLLTGTPPRIGEFRGDGPLRAWLRAVAVRVALNARREQHREEPRAGLPELPASAAGPERAVANAEQRARFKQAFEAAVAGLEPRDRTVLRLHALDGLSLAAIGKMYAKDASTVSRWLDRIRAQLNEATRAELSGDALGSLLREVSVSLSRLLAD